MKVQSVNSISFRAKKSVKANNVKKAVLSEENLKFKKNSGIIMRRAVLFSALMLTATAFYFERILKKTK